MNNDAGTQAARVDSDEIEKRSSEERGRVVSRRVLKHEKECDEEKRSPLIRPKWDGGKFVPNPPAKQEPAPENLLNEGYDNYQAHETTADIEKIGRAVSSEKSGAETRNPGSLWKEMLDHVR